MAQITIQQNVADSYLYSFLPNNNYGSSSSLYVGGYYSKATQTYRSILLFPLDTLPSGSIINSAKLVLYASNGAESAEASNIHRLTQPNWDEDDVTWDDYDFDTPWGTAGGDYTETGAIAWSLPTSTGSFEITGLKDLLIDAINNRNNELHILLKRFSEIIIDSRLTISSSDSPSNQPQLIIDYTPPKVIDLGPEAKFTSSGSVSYVSVDTFDPNTFVIVYEDGFDSNHGTAKIGKVNNKTITFYEEEEFLSSDTTDLYSAVATFDASGFVVAYADGSDFNHGTVKIGIVSGTTIAFGNKSEFLSSYTNKIAIATIDTSTFVVVYNDFSAGNVGAARIGTISGTSVTFGDETEFYGPGFITDVCITVLNTSGFVVSYRDPFEENSSGVVKIGTVSGTYITFSDEISLDGSQPIFLCLGTLDSNTIVSTYQDFENNDNGTVQIGTVNGTSIDFDERIIYSDDVTDNEVTVLDSSGFIIAYGDGNDSDHGNVRLGVLDDLSNVYFSRQVEFLGSGISEHTSLATLDTNKFVIAYRDTSDSNNGAARIGTIGTEVLASGDLFIHGYDIFQASGNLFVHGHEDISVSGDLFINGYDIVSNSGILFIEGSTGFISVSGSKDLFINGYNDYIASGDLFIHGQDIAQISGDLFTRGYDNKTSASTLFINGFIETSSLLPPPLFIHGHVSDISSGNLFIHSHDTFSVSGDLFTFGFQQITTSGNLFIEGSIEFSGISAPALFIHGYDTTFTSGNLFIAGQNSTSISGDLFTGGYDTIFGSGDLFIHGYDTFSASGDLFILGSQETITSGNLFVYGRDSTETSGSLFINGFVEFSGILTPALFIRGHNTAFASGNLYINGSGIIPITDILTLFINGFEPRKPVSCPILDPTAAIQISNGIINVYQSHIDALINQLGKNVTLNFDPQLEQCPNCIYDAINKRSTGVYKLGGPWPFEPDRQCPYCKGRGILETLSQKCIKCLIKWNSQDTERYGISIEKKKATVRLKTYITEMDDLFRASTAIVDMGQVDIIESLVRRIKDPIPVGLREDRYCISFWELV